MSKAQREELKRALQAQSDDLRSVAATPQGRRLLYLICEHAGILDRAFSPDPYVTAHMAGRRDVGLWLLGWLQTSARPLYDKMLNEASTAAEEKAREAEKAVASEE